MSAVFGYLFLLVPIIAIGGIVWAYQKKSADKEARSRERLAALVGISQNAGAAPGAARREHAAAGAGSKPAVLSAPLPARRERFLTQSETLLYYVLKAGLPGHEVFPHVSLPSVLDAPGNAFGQTSNLQPGHAAHDLDFVVCDKSMRIVAAIRLEGRTASQVKELMYRRLTDAGIRLVVVYPNALPRREQVHALIYGQPA
jgi:hypothetical protein